MPDYLRHGVLALFDQPPIKPGTAVVPPQPSADHVLLSIDPAKLASNILSMAREDPQTAEKLTAFAQRFRDQTGLSLRDDLLAKIGPRMAFIPSGQGLGSAISFWFHPPDLWSATEAKDGTISRPRSTDWWRRRIREAKAAGAMVRPQPGRPVRPGTVYAEFRRLKTPEHGYVLAVPPSVLPTPAGLRPTCWSSLKGVCRSLPARPPRPAARKILFDSRPRGLRMFRQETRSSCR